MSGLLRSGIGTVAIAAVLLFAAVSSAFGAYQHNVVLAPWGGVCLVPTDLADVTSLNFTVYTSAKTTCNAGTAQYTSYYDETQSSVTIDRNLTTRSFFIPVGEPDGIKTGWNLIVLKQGTTVVEKIPLWYDVPTRPVSVQNASLVATVTAPVPVVANSTLPVALQDGASVAISTDSTLPVSAWGTEGSDALRVMGGLIMCFLGLFVGRSVLNRKRVAA